MWQSTPSPAEHAGAWLRRAWTLAARTARLAIGIPDYERYLAHMRLHHPDHAPMDRAGFFRERMAARYGAGRARCC